MVLVAAPRMQVADRESFIAASRMLFGPIAQVFDKGAVPTLPTLLSVDLGSCRLTEIRATAHGVVADSLLRRSFDPDAIKILLQISGRSRFEQQSVAVDLEPRSSIIYDPVRTYCLQNLCDVDQLILQVPRATLSDDALRRLRSPLPVAEQEDCMARIVAGLMQMAISEADRLAEADCRRVGDSLIQLVHGLIRGEPGAAELRRTSLDALRERIVTYIDANIGHNDLSVDSIARHMGCSRRYLYRAFEGEDVTPERFIWDRRLERSRAALLSPANGTASISEIAFACGFNSSAHFSRAFKRKYKVGPRALRGRARDAVH